MVGQNLFLQHWRLSYPLWEPMQGSFSTPEISSLFHREEGLCIGNLSLYQQLPWGSIHFCSKGIPWSLFALHPCLSHSDQWITAKRDTATCKVTFCLWWYLILYWSQAVLNSAFFWPNSPRTLTCNERGHSLRCRVCSGEQWEGAPTHLQVVVALCKSQLCSKHHRFVAFPFLSKALY